MPNLKIDGREERERKKEEDFRTGDAGKNRKRGNVDV